MATDTRVDGRARRWPAVAMGVAALTFTAAASMVGAPAVGAVAPAGTPDAGVAVARGSVWIERNGAALSDTSCAEPGFPTITEAVDAAQSNDVIHVCAGTYTERQIVVDVDGLTIVGDGATPADVVLDGGSANRIIDARKMSITLRNLTLQNGFATVEDGDTNTYGGAILGYQIVLDDVVMRDNDAHGGGAVFASVKGFAVEAAVAELAPSVMITDSEFIDNGVGSAIGGGAVYVMGGDVSVVDSTFTGNQALLTNEAPLPGTDGAGGAILAGTVTVAGSTFEDNAALQYGGAISASWISTTASDTQPRSLFRNNSAGEQVQIEVAGLGPGLGGALQAYGVDIESTWFDANTADLGGAVAMSGAAVQDADVISLVPGEAIVTSSTFSANTATVRGGAIWNEVESGSTTSSNSTYYANIAGPAGGAIYSRPPLTLTFNTFDSNVATVSGGVFFAELTPVITHHNIFAVAQIDGVGPEVVGCGEQNWTWYDPANDVGNLSTNDWCPGWASPVSASDLALGALGDNGGPTPTIALGASSVAIDAVADVQYCDEKSRDQRLVQRPVGVRCDVGAYEYFGEITLDTTPGVERTLSLPAGSRTLYAAIVGGGGGAGLGEGSGGGGGGEVDECSFDVTGSTDVVTYFFGRGGAVGQDGEASYIAVNGINVCEAAGGAAGVAADAATNPGSGGASGAGSLGGAAALDGGVVVAGGGGGGAGGSGGDGSFSLESGPVGGVGGPGVRPSSPAFGDLTDLLGAGGSGGALIAVVCGGLEVAVCADGVSGPGATEVPALGQGGDGGSSASPASDGASGSGEVRSSLSTGEQLTICLDKLYVIYGDAAYRPKVSLCEPCPVAPPPAPQSGSRPDPCATPAPTTDEVQSAHYEHGIPDGWRRVTSDEYPPGLVLPTCTTDYVVGMGVADSTREITCTGDAPEGYEFDYSLLEGGLRIHPAVLTVTPKDVRVVYGSPEPTYSFSVSGFRLGQNSSVLTTPVTCDSEYLPTSPVGSRFPITCSGAADNYEFVTRRASVTVTKAKATITATPVTVTYGDSAPTYTFTVSNLMDGDTVDTLAGFVPPRCSSSYRPTTSAGSNPSITCSGASATNYEFRYVSAKVTVNKATLTVTPNNLTVKRGAKSPTYTFSVTGWKNGQNAKTASGYKAPNCSSSYTKSSPTGSYTITCRGGAASNYVFTYGTATLTVI